MNADLNTDSQDFNSEEGKAQGAIDSDPAPVATSERTSESSSDFVVAPDGQVTRSMVEQDSRSFPADEESPEIPQVDTVPMDSQSDAGQVDHELEIPQLDVQSDVSHTDLQPAVPDDSMQLADGSQRDFQDGISQVDSEPGAFRAAPAQPGDSTCVEPRSDASQTEYPQPINGSQVNSSLGAFQADYQESDAGQFVSQEETASGDSRLSASEQDFQSANSQRNTPQTGPQNEAVQAGFQPAVGSQFNTVPDVAPVGAGTQPMVSQFGPQPVAPQFGGSQGGSNPIPPTTAGAGPAYPSQTPYPVQTLYMAQSQYLSQPQQSAPPVQREDRGQANGMSIAAIILAVVCWPLGLIFSIIGICVSSGRKNRTSRILSLFALGISLLLLLTTCIAFFVVIHSSFNIVDKAIKDATSQTYSPADQSTDGSDGNLDDDDDWESGLEYSGYAGIETICDLTNGLEFIA